MNKIFRLMLCIILTGAVLSLGAALALRLNSCRTEEADKVRLSTEYRRSDTVNFNGLAGRNKDTIAWIYLPGSGIDYPILQSRDNKFYLSHGFDRKKAAHGSIFIDCKNANPFLDFNTVIYGKAPLSGSMLYSLRNYKDIEYTKVNPVIRIYTPGKSYDLHVIAYMNEPKDSLIYATYFGGLTSGSWGSMQMTKDASSKATKAEFIALLERCSPVIPPGSFGEDDRYVILSVMPEGRKSIFQVAGVLKEETIGPVTQDTAARENTENRTEKDRSELIQKHPALKKLTEKIRHSKLIKNQPLSAGTTRLIKNYQSGKYPYINKWLFLQILILCITIRAAVLIPICFYSKGSEIEYFQTKTQRTP